MECPFTTWRVATGIGVSRPGKALTASMTAVLSKFCTTIDSDVDSES
ncbi:hypothetical protein FORC065_0435 [Yersinia enterocolitica]|nr:hypothetical protein FORC065_0435 [Yersinia enterocolitica]